MSRSWRSPGANRSLGRLSQAVGYLIPIIALTLSVSGCASRVSDDRLLVVATTTILGDVVSEIMQDRGDVEVLIPAGADLHSFQASSRQVAIMQRADLVVAIGFTAEEGLQDALGAVRDEGVKVLEIAPLADPIPFSDGRDHSHDGGDDDDSHKGDMDPHIWLDPVRMAEVSRAIGEELTKLDPSVDWETEAIRYSNELLAADAQIRETLSTVPENRRYLVVDHQSFGYFAERYGFEVLGTVIPGAAALSDPSSAELAALVADLKDYQIGAIFVDALRPANLSEAVAGELGGEVEIVELRIGSLGEPGSETDTLIKLLVSNAERIAEALS